MIAVRHILVVDDDDRFRSTLGRMLDRLGYQATAVPDARAAVAAIETARYDVMLVDLRMPEINGHMLLRLLSTIDSAPPVVAMSGEGDMEDVLAVLRANAADFLKKPFHPSELERAIQRAISISAERGAAPRPSSPTESPSPNRAPAPPPAQEAEQRPPARATRQAGSSAAAEAVPTDVLADVAAGLLAGTVDAPNLVEAGQAVRRLLTLPAMGVDRVVDLVGRDRGLSARIVGAANDANAGRPVTRVRDACVRLGNLEVIAITQSYAMRPAYDLNPHGLAPVGAAMLRNAAVVSNASRELARLLPAVDGVDPAAAQMTGFLHNIGEAIALRILAERAGDALPADPADRRAWTAARVDPHHEKIGAAVLTKWGLPPALVALVRTHHEPLDGPPIHELDRQLLVVQLAWGLAVSAGYSYHSAIAPDVDVIIDQLGMDANRVKSKVLRRAKQWARSCG